MLFSGRLHSTGGAATAPRCLSRKPTIEARAVTTAISTPSWTESATAAKGRVRGLGAAELEELERRVTGCRRCPRLVEWRERVARREAGRLPRRGVLGPARARASATRGRSVYVSASPRPRTAATAPAASSPATAPATGSSRRSTAPASPTSRPRSPRRRPAAARRLHDRRGALRPARATGRTPRSATTASPTPRASSTLLPAGG